MIEVGSYTKAAEILGYAQPALSQMITVLEKEISITLLYRSRYGIKLTPEGEHLFPVIQETVAQYEKLKGMEQEIQGLHSGVVRIGTVSSISCHWLPVIIEEFWKEKIVRTMALVTKDKREISVAAKTFMRFVLKHVK